MYTIFSEIILLLIVYFLLYYNFFTLLGALYVCARVCVCVCVCVCEYRRRIVGWKYSEDSKCRICRFTYEKEE